MSLTKIGSDLYKEKRWPVLGYVGSGAMAYLSPGVLFAFSAYLLSKSALKPGILTLGVAIGSVRFFAVARGASQYGERLIGHGLVLEYVARVRVALFESLSKVVPHRLTPGVFGDLMAALNGDMEEVQSLLLRLIGPMLSTAVASLVAIVIAFAFSVPFGVVTSITVLVMGVLAPWLFYGNFKRRIKQSSESRSNVYRSASSVTGTFSERRLLGDQDVLVEDLLEKTARSSRFQVLLGTGQIAMACLEALVEVAALVVTTYLGVTQIEHHSLGKVYVAVVPFLLLGTLEGLSLVAVEISRTVSTAPSIRRLNEMLSFEPRELPSCPSTLSDQGPLDIALDGVYFSYPQSERPVLEDLSLHLNGGEHLLVSGVSGGGKSTLASLILGGRLPTLGEIRLGGVSTRHLSEEVIAEKVGYLGPEPYVFDATIEANLLIAAPLATSQELEESLSKVGLSDWLHAQPDGLRSKVSMRSENVSSGERQRIALSRVLLHQSRTLVLDEPTANLDDENEKMVVELINELFADATVIAITHSELFAYMYRYDKHLEL